MATDIYLVDAFSDRCFSGNPAAVCLLASARSVDWMQSLAAEMNQSETVFVSPRPYDDGYELCWFPPTTEVALCGHATLAAAHVLWSEGLAGRQQALQFHSASGVLTATCRDDRIELDFPLDEQRPTVASETLLAALGQTPAYVGRGRHDLLVVLDGERRLQRLQPDLRLLAQLDVRGVCVTAPADDAETDFVSRFFAPAAGIDEDPVTGSAHCLLAHYWRERLGKSCFSARQISARGGWLTVTIDGQRVLLAGAAVMVWRGSLL